MNYYQLICETPDYEKNTCTATWIFIMFIHT
jgi:hypothetical protein